METSSQSRGTVTYTKLEGAVVFDDVDFGYTDDKIVCTISAYWRKTGTEDSPL